MAPGAASSHFPSRGLWRHKEVQPRVDGWLSPPAVGILEEFPLITKLLEWD